MDLASLQPLILADFMRPLPGSRNAYLGMQNSITFQLASWISPSLNMVFGKKAEIAIWDDEIPGNMPSRQIYEAMNCDPSTEGWTTLYHQAATPEVVELLAPYFEGKLLIGFELSPFLKSALAGLKTPYLSLAIHPVRFLKDYVFMLESNFIPDNILSDFSIHPDEIYFAAQLKAAEMQRRHPLSIHSNSAVLFGQVEVDAALIKDQSLVSLQSNMGALRDFCSDYDHIYFKPHPYQNQVGSQLRFVRQFSNVEIVDNNPYALLANPEINTVSALTSSVLTEAVFFGKRAHALSDIWQSKDEEPAFDLRIFSPSFWKAIILGEGNTNTDLSLLSSDLKSLLGVSWENNGRSEIAPSGRQLSLGQRVLFGTEGDGAPVCVGTGWWAPSRDHVWSKSTGGTFSFRTLPGNTNAFRVELEIAAMATKDHPVDCTFMANQEVLHQCRFEAGNKRTESFVIYPKHQSKLGDVLITMHCSAINSPHMLHAGSSDHRAMSVAAYSIRLCSTQNAELFNPGEVRLVSTLNSASPLLHKGWNEIEGDFVWTGAVDSSLRVALMGPAETDYELVLGDTSALLSEYLPTNTLFACVNGETQKVFSFQYGEKGDCRIGGIDIRIPIPRSAIQNHQVAEVELRLITCTTPEILKINADDRTLGIRVGSFKLCSVIPALAELPSDHAVNIFGPFNIETGLAVMARNVFSAIETAHGEDDARESKELLGPRAINFNNSQHEDIDSGYVDHQASGSDTNLFIGDVTRVAKIIREHGNDFLNDRYSICYGAWELAEMPTYLTEETWINEYWGLSTFIADAARARMTVPVYAFPIPVQLHFPKTIRSRESFGIPNDRFIFLFTFSVDSTIARKNPGAILRAFQLAFPLGTEPVCMVFKCMIRQSSPANRTAFDAFKDEIKHDKRIILISEMLPRDENASLYMVCDAFVSLHRAEGFGLTMAEAMGYGKPTIGTGYSGNLDFMSSDNSCLVDYELVSMDAGSYHDQAQKWADPDPSHAAHWMKKIFDDDLFREKIARAGKYKIYKDFSKAAVGRNINTRLRDIREGK